MPQSGSFFDPKLAYGEGRFTSLKGTPNLTDSNIIPLTAEAAAAATRRKVVQEEEQKQKEKEKEKEKSKSKLQQSNKAAPSGLFLNRKKDVGILGKGASGGSGVDADKVVGRGETPAFHGPHPSLFSTAVRRTTELLQRALMVYSCENAVSDGGRCDDEAEISMEISSDVEDGTSTDSSSSSSSSNSSSKLGYLHLCMLIAHGSRAYSADRTGSGTGAQGQRGAGGGNTSLGVVGSVHTLQVRQGLRFQGSIIYTVDLLFHVGCCIRQL